jgi:WD repeat-containing protein 61
MTFSVLKTVPDAHEDAIWSLTWTNKSNRILTGSIDDTVKMWSGESAAHMRTLDGHNLGVTSVVSSANGVYAASASLDSQIRIWDVLQHSLIKYIDAGPMEAWVNTICNFSLFRFLPMEA